MYNQLLLPISDFEPSDFSVVAKTSDNFLAIEWLSSWGQKNGSSSEINYTCLMGLQAPLLALIWSRINNAYMLSSDARLFKDIYKIMNKKGKNKHYLLTNPELIKDEQVIVCILNLIKEYKSYLLLITKIHPNDWYIKLPDLKSRISTINLFTC